MPTEIRSKSYNSGSSDRLSDVEKSAEKSSGTYSNAKGDSIRRKYALLILCIPVLTGAYALLTTQACDEDYFIAQPNDGFFESSSRDKILTKHKHHTHVKPIDGGGGGVHIKDPGKSKKVKHKKEPKDDGVSSHLTDFDSAFVREKPPVNDAQSLSTGGGSCKTQSNYCGLHGKCLPSGECACTVLYHGSRCEHAKEFPAGVHPKSLKKKTLKFNGEMVLHQSKMKQRDKLKVFLPNKEKDADKGHRVLSDGDELKRLIQTLPQNDTILNGKIYDKCAIVGSSGIVLSFEHGKEIDSHDFVMRFNSAPTKGFEKHVGSFTTHRITNTQNWAFRERDDENLLIHLRAKSAVIGLFYNYRSKSRRKKEWIPHLWAFDPNYVEFVAHSLTFMATSGLYGIMIAMQRCREVNIYGFHVATKQGALYHYYDVCDVPANPSRDGDEFRFVKALSNAGFLNFAEDCVLECHESNEVCSKCKEEKNFKIADMASMKHCKPNRVSEGHNIVPWASRRARSRFRRKHPNRK